MNKRVGVVVLLVFSILIIGIGSYLMLFSKDDTKKDITGDNSNISTMEIYTVKYEINNAEKIDSTKASCLVENGKCKVLTPNIIAKEGSYVVGWALTPDSKEKIYAPLQEIELTKDITLYAIVKDTNESNINVGTVCNKNCNYNLSILNVACSQIGYYEKKTDSDLDNCTNNKGDNDYNKFGNSNNAWQEAFINWSFDQIGVNLNKEGIVDVDDIDSYIEWAKNSKRWFISKSDLHDGDLVVLDNTIGIALYENDNWYMILGNRNNKVDKIIINNAVGFIHMNDLSY